MNEISRALKVLLQHWTIKVVIFNVTVHHQLVVQSDTRSDDNMVSASELQYEAEMVT